MWAAKALVSLCFCSVSPEPLLLNNAVSTKISSTDLYVNKVIVNLKTYKVRYVELMSFLSGNCPVCWFNKLLGKYLPVQ